MNKIKSLASTVLLLMMCFMFAACPPDPDPDIENSNLVNTLKMYKYEYYYVDEFTDTDYGGFWGTSTYRLYFLDNNVGFEHVIYKDHDTSLGDSKDSFFMKFTYSVSGNTIRLRYENGSETYTYTYKGSYLESDDGTRYIGSKMTQSDKDFVDRTVQELEEEEENKEIVSSVYSSVDITYEYVKEDRCIEFTIDTELSKEYPGKTFKYGIEYGYGDYKYTSYCEMGGKSSWTFRMSILFAECALYYESYMTLREKIDNGEKLTDSEQNLLENLVYYIEKDVKKFKARYFVEFNGEKFYINAYFYNIEIDLDDSYNNLSGEESDNKDDNDDGGNDNSDDWNNSYTGIINGHEYVDLGLSVKWATCNVGASKPEDYGDYYAWGETTTKSDYSWETYKWCKGTWPSASFTKYCTNSNYGIIDNLTILLPSDDVATVEWGDNWRMPTKEDFEELINNCTWIWIVRGNSKGYKVIGPNGNSIYFPAAGYRNGTGIIDRTTGLYWSATLSDSYSDCACYLGLKNDGYGMTWYFRVRGQSIRLVIE